MQHAPARVSPAPQRPRTSLCLLLWALGEPPTLSARANLDVQTGLQGWRESRAVGHTHSSHRAAGDRRQARTPATLEAVAVPAGCLS